MILLFSCDVGHLSITNTGITICCVSSIQTSLAEILSRMLPSPGNPPGLKLGSNRAQLRQQKNAFPWQLWRRSGGSLEAGRAKRESCIHLASKSRPLVLPTILERPLLFMYGTQSSLQGYLVKPHL